MESVNAVEEQIQEQLTSVYWDVIHSRRQEFDAGYDDYLITQGALWCGDILDGERQAEITRSVRAVDISIAEFMRIDGKFNAIRSGIECCLDDIRGGTEPDLCDHILQQKQAQLNTANHIYNYQEILKIINKELSQHCGKECEL